MPSPRPIFGSVMACRFLGTMPLPRRFCVIVNWNFGNNFSKIKIISIIEENEFDNVVYRTTSHFVSTPAGWYNDVETFSPFLTLCEGNPIPFPKGQWCGRFSFLWAWISRWITIELLVIWDMITLIMKHPDDITLKYSSCLGNTVIIKISRTICRVLAFNFAVLHYSDVIISTMASQISSMSIVY